MNCTKCNAAIPAGAAFKFCPFCGNALQRATAARNANTDPYNAAVPDITASERETSPDASPVSDTQIAAAAAAVPADDGDYRDTLVGASPVDDPHEAPTRMELPAITDDALGGAASAPAPTPAPALEIPKVVVADADATVEDLPIVPESVRSAPTAAERAVAQAPTEPIRRKSEPAKSAPRRAPAARPSADSGPKDPATTDNSREFSETAWFLAAVSPEQLSETEGEATDFAEQDRMTERYKATRLPTDVRKSFSLNVKKGGLTLEETGAVDDD